jgi:hypothetical protein
MDFTDKYNTILSKEEESKFNQWLSSFSKESGYDRAQDLRDYDLRGAWKELQTNPDLQSENGHFPDTYKKPNHPTFSTESIYEGVDGFYGGTWQKLKNGSYRFHASPTTMWNEDELRAYFKSFEAGNELVLPQYENILENPLLNKGK